MRACPDCGANLDLVGSRHRCVPKPKTEMRPAVNTKPDVANDVANTAAVANATYRYRDVEKRRAYIKSYMAERRRSKPAAGSKTAV